MRATSAAHSPKSLVEGTAQRWRDHGRLFDPQNGLDPGWTHGAYPTPVPLSENRLRVFFTARDEWQRGHLFAQDFRFEVGKFYREGKPFGPLLAPGKRGEFDQSGTAVTAFAEKDGEVLCYYLGWSQRKDTPFQNFIGLARASNYDGPFTRSGRVPIIDRSAVDPLSVGYPEVYRVGNGRWQMVYGSHHEWGEGWLEMLHVLHRAESADGVTWHPVDEITLDVIGPSDREEFALSKPTVLRVGDRWHMWYARRYEHYKLGYATSADGIVWHRRDALLGNIAEGGSDFRSEEMTYPSIAAFAGRIFLFYNGNGYGRSGFGVTELVG